MYGHYDRDTDCRRSLCKRHASEWRIIKSQHRRGPLWPLGKDGQEQTWLNERRSFSRYGARPAYKLTGIFYLRHRYQGLWGRAPILSVSENVSKLHESIDGPSRSHNFVSLRARRNLNAGIRMSAMKSQCLLELWKCTSFCKIVLWASFR